MKKVVVVTPQGPGKFVLATELSSAVNQLKISQNTARGDSFKCGDPHCMCLNYVKHKWKPKVTLCVECHHPREYHTAAPVIPESKTLLLETGFSEEDEEDKTATLPPLDLNLFQPLPPQLGAAGLNDMVEVTKFLNATLRNFIVEKRGGQSLAEDTGNLKQAEQELEIQLLRIALEKERKASAEHLVAQQTIAKLVTELQEVAAFAKLESTRAKSAEQELAVVSEKLSSLMSSHIALTDKYDAISSNNDTSAQDKVTAAEKALESLQEKHAQTLTELENLQKQSQSVVASSTTSDAEMESLTHQIQSLKQENETAKQQLKDRESAHATLVSELNSAKQQLTQLQNTISASSSSSSSTTSSISQRDSQSSSSSSSKSPPLPPTRESLSSPPPPPPSQTNDNDNNHTHDDSSDDNNNDNNNNNDNENNHTNNNMNGDINNDNITMEAPAAPPWTEEEHTNTRARSRRIHHPSTVLVIDPPSSPSRESIASPLASSDPSVLSEMQQKVHMELVTTEETYLKGLRLLVHSFVIPLKALASDPTFGVAQDHISYMCSNLETLLNFHTVFYDALSRPGASAGNTVLVYSDFFKMYIYYLNGYEKSLTTMDALRKHKRFQIFLSKVKFDLRKEGGLDLMSYLIMPVQRVPRYVMLLKELLKNTPSAHPEHAALSEALSKVTAVAGQINEAKRHMEHMTQLLELQNQIVGELPGPLLVVGRVLLRRSLVYKKDLAGKKKMQFLFLFNDLVLWTSEGYRYKNQRALVATGMALEVDEKTKEAGVEITTNTDCIIFYFPGPNASGTLKSPLATTAIPEEAETAAKQWIQDATNAKEAALQAREDKRKTRAKKLAASTSGVVTEIKTLMTSRLQELNQGKTTPIRQAYTRKSLEAASIKSFSALGATGDKNSTLERSHTLGKNLTLDHYVKPEKEANGSKRLSGSLGGSASMINLGLLAASASSPHRQTIFDRDQDKEHLSLLVKNATLPKDFVEHPKSENKAAPPPPPSSTHRETVVKLPPLLDFTDETQVFCVRVQVFGAAHLRRADAFGLSDPYCEVAVMGVMQRTPVIYNTLSPVWNSTFYFFSLESPSEIKFELWDEDDSQTLKNDLLGLGAFSLQGQFNTQESKCVIPVNFKGEQKGTMDVAVLCKTCCLRK